MTILASETKSSNIDEKKKEVNWVENHRTHTCVLKGETDPSVPTVWLSIEHYHEGKKKWEFK